MVEALNRIKAFHGPDAKAIVWEHNTHIGDARATDMEADGMVNVGQVLREQYGNNRVYVVGFGTHRGTVIAADQWGGEMQSMEVPEAQSGSWEDLMHKAGAYDKILLFDHDPEPFLEPVGTGLSVSCTIPAANAEIMCHLLWPCDTTLLYM